MRDALKRQHLDEGGVLPGGMPNMPSALLLTVLIRSNPDPSPAPTPKPTLTLPLTPPLTPTPKQVLDAHRTLCCATVAHDVSSVACGFADSAVRAYLLKDPNPNPNPNPNPHPHPHPHPNPHPKPNPNQVRVYLLKDKEGQVCHTGLEPRTSPNSHV